MKFHKLYRRLIDWKETFLSKCRILNYRLKYPSLQIDYQTTIGKNCIIRCVDGSNCSITNSHLSHGTFIVAEAGSTLKISDSSLGPGSVIVARQHIEIRSHCSIAEMVVIRDQDHDYRSGKLIKESGYITGPVILEENVWIGAKATILKNVRIGMNSVVGSHSLVNRNFPPNSVIAGIPAKIIKVR
jgi:NDP-sugar pyrophosphorylase family protein